MTEYELVKMDIAEIKEKYHDTLEKNAAEVAEKNRLERCEIIDKQIKSILIALVLIVAPTGVFFIPNPESLIGVAGIVCLVGFGFLFRAIGLAGKAKRLEQYTDPQKLIGPLAAATKEAAIQSFFAKNWLCPYCGQPNDKNNTAKCEHCGKAYNDMLVVRYEEATKKAKKLAPVLSDE